MPPISFDHIHLLPFASEPTPRPPYTPLIATVRSLFNLDAFRSWLSFLQSSNPSHL